MGLEARKEAVRSHEGTFADLAPTLRTTEGAVYSFASRHGIKSRYEQRNLELREGVERLIKDGLSYSEMADRLGSTRGAVAGIVDRLKLQGVLTTPPAAPALRTRLPDIPNSPPLAGSTPTDLLDTTGCRWPVRGGFCNEAISERHYCMTHYRKSYVPTAPIRVTRKGKIVL